MKKVVVVLAFLLFALSLTPLSPLYAYTPDANAPRVNVPTMYKWDTTPLFKSDGQWESAFNQVESSLKHLLSIKDKIGSADSLRNFLDEYMKTQRIMGRVSLYVGLKSAEDEEVEKYQKMRQRTADLVRQFQAPVLFDVILRMNDEKADKLINNKSLAEYKDYLSELKRRKAHLLGTEAEKVLATLGDNLWVEGDLNEIPSDVELIFKATLRDIELPKIKDENGKEVQLTLANYGKYRASKDRDVRRGTVEGFFKALKQHQNVLGQTLAGEFKRDVALAKARKYDRAVDAYLDREDINPKVVDTLINAVHANLGVLHKYVALRKKILNLPDIHIYDLYTPLVPAAAEEIPYDKGSENIVSALKPLGDEYVSVLANAIKAGSGWVDIYPNKGKESGAFSSSTYGIHPFIKMNYMDEVDDVSTLAHEFGHAMHSHFNMQSQPYISSGYSTMLAEIASTFNEALLSEHLVSKYKDNDAMRLYLLGERIETIRTTIYRQTLFTEFEKIVHGLAETGKPITADILNKTYKNLIKRYYGPEFSIGENDDIEWAYIPHFYWKYYMYSYATGLSSGIALSQDVLKQGGPARERYLNMLKASVYEPPLEILKKAGVDLTKPDAVNAAARLMSQTIDEMEKIVGKN